MILALALSVAAPIDRRDAMERCAEAVVAVRRPGGMVDVTGISFEWLSISGTGDRQVIIGAIVEPDGTGRTARRFQCTLREPRPPRIAMLRTIRL